MKLFLLIISLFFSCLSYSQSWINIFGKNNFNDSLKFSKYKNNDSMDSVLITDKNGRLKQKYISGNGGGFTGWDDMLSKQQAQSINRKINLNTHNLTFDSVGVFQINSGTNNWFELNPYIGSGESHINILNPYSSGNYSYVFRSSATDNYMSIFPVDNSSGSANYWGSLSSGYNDTFATRRFARTLTGNYVKYSDTATMLSPYVRTANLPSLTGYMKYTDSATMLSPYFRKSDTTGKWLGVGYLATLNGKMNTSDTSTMLGGYTRRVTATSPITSSGGQNPIISTSMNTNKLIGRSTSGVGVMEEISIGTGLSLSGGTLTNTINLSGYVPYSSYGINNVSANIFFDGFTSVVASATQIVLTVNSTPSYLITGSGDQTIKLPDATTLPNGTVYDFNNNQSSGTISVNNNSNTLVKSIPSGGYLVLTLIDNSIAAGSWDAHFQAPSNVSWSTNTFSYPGTFTGGTWNGSAIGILYGGTGATTASSALSNLGGQPLNTNLTSIGGLANGAGYLYNNGSGTFSYASPTSTNIYNTDGTLTGNRTISTTSGYTLAINPTTTFTGTVAMSDIVTSGSGSLAGSLLNLTQTWNTTGTPTAIKLNVTTTAASNSSLLIDLQSNSSSQFSINRYGVMNLTGVAYIPGIQSSANLFNGGVPFTSAFSYNGTYNPTTGTVSSYGVNISPTLNQAGTASGNFYGFYFNPTVTSMLGSVIAFQNTKGNVLLGTTSGSVSIGTSSTVSSAILNISSTTQGFLPPRTTTTLINGITGIEGLQIYDNTLHVNKFYNGTAWDTYGSLAATQTWGGTTNTFNSKVVFGSTAQLKSYTVATLPTGTQGMIAYVTDALAPTFLVAVVGNGAVVCPVFYNGTAWVAH